MSPNARVRPPLEDELEKCQALQRPVRRVAVATTAAGAIVRTRSAKQVAPDRLPHPIVA